MTDKDLIQQLSKLKTLKPDSEWKDRNRDILLSQIGNSTDDSKKVSFWTVLDNFLPESITMLASKPAMVFAAILVVVLGGSVLSIKAAKETKPGDSLYIAKIVSEKTQLALTFDNTSKAKLNLQFAGNRAEELAKITEAPESETKTGNISSLTDNFKREINEAKTRLNTDSAQIAKAPEKNDNNNPDNVTDNSDEKIQVVGAALEKDDQSLQLSAPTEPVARSLAEAEKLFENKDYNGTTDKLKEVTETINNPTEVTVPIKPTTPTTTMPVATSTTATTTK